MADRNFWILTREQYYALVDKAMAAKGKRLKQRWDKGELKKGRCDLLARDLVQDRLEEFDDQEAYEIMEAEKQRRRKIAEGWAEETI